MLAFFGNRVDTEGMPPVKLAYELFLSLNSWGLFMSITVACKIWLISLRKAKYMNRVTIFNYFDKFLSFSWIAMLFSCTMVPQVVEVEDSLQTTYITILINSILSGIYSILIGIVLHKNLFLIYDVNRKMR